jgi:phosphoribosyl 1,2-cyclic phosphodiesterase
MQLTVIGSGSSGNCYLLESTQDAIVLDCGIPFIQVKKALDFNVRGICGLLVTHSHGDHVKYLKDYINSGIKVYMHPQTSKEVGILDFKERFMVRIMPYNKYKIGSFIIMPFPLQHDVTCMGYQITHEEFGNFVYITDTRDCRFYFEGINNWLIECNHSERLINERVGAGVFDVELARRIMDNHLSIEGVLEILKDSNAESSNKVILCHASNQNSNQKEFIREIIHEIGVDTYMAAKGLKLCLNP